MLPQYTNVATEEQKKAVAELMLHCGVAMDMDYNLSAAGGSGAGIFKQYNALTKFFGYNPNIYFEGLRVDKPTYDRAFINNKPNRLNFNLNRSDYGTGWEPLIVALYFIMLVGGLACVIIEGIKYMIDIKEHLS